MKPHLYRHLWGVGETWGEVFPKIKQNGYHGIECPLPAASEREPLRRLLKEFGFFYIPQIFTSGKTVEEHVQSFEVQLRESNELRPVRVNCHSGRDAFTESDAITFFRDALRIEQELVPLPESNLAFC